ncbi:MAG: TIGR03862 family flavoprotein [Flavobacteriales bacterium]|nr:TIGR03862 family flavoprotein [Flavobacteriales bacterium]
MKIAIIGGGPSALIAADVLGVSHSVDLYERGRTVGRKFLVAGDGGLNIANSAQGEDLLSHYTHQEFMRPILKAFGPDELRAWLSDMGVRTFVGSSGRVFPEKGVKPAQVLKAMKDRVVSKGVRIHTNSMFVGFDAQTRPLIKTSAGIEVLSVDHYIFALGGASWPRTGSVGEWLSEFERIGVRTFPFRSSNCGVEISWPTVMNIHAGKPLKNIAIGVGNKFIRGEATITEYGLEGNAIYPNVPLVRDQLTNTGKAEIMIDLKPDNTVEQIFVKLKDHSPKEWPTALSMTRAQFALIKSITSKEQFQNAEVLAQVIKCCTLEVEKLRPIEEAISSIGGIALSEVSAELGLLEHPHISVVGEMLDVDAPTGGFLLQMAFSMGYWVAKCINGRTS